MASITIRPLQQGLPFGVRINGVDHTVLDQPEIREQIAQAFEQHGMIVFEDIEPSNAMQVKVSEVFGPLKEHPVAGVERVDKDGLPGVVAIASPPNTGGVVSLDGKRLSHWLPWHFDHCYNDELNRAGVLRAIEIVPEGGITGFADGVALYSAFPKALLARIEDAKIVYTLSVQYGPMRFGRPDGFEVIQPKPAPPDFEEHARRMPRALHPAVWTRSTGEKVLHISPWMAQGISGAENDDGNALLEEVSQEIRRLASLCSYHHKWKPTDMVIWDNWRMLHSVSGHDPSLGRTMYRTTIKGDYGLGHFEGDGIGGKILETTV
jgi:taurine dioxygenase